jgi:hypothetical protein
MSAYTTAEPYSIDVPQAILRQGVFVAKAHALGWTDTDFIGSSDALLHRAQVRYHACARSFIPSRENYELIQNGPQLPGFGLSSATKRMLGSHFGY